MLKDKITMTKYVMILIFLLGTLTSSFIISIGINNILAGLLSAIGFLLTLILIYSNS